jgi:hypothetical protein
MHPSISSELVAGRIADLRRQAQRGVPRRAAVYVPAGEPHPAESQVLTLLRPGRERQAYPATVGSTAS